MNKVYNDVSIPNPCLVKTKKAVQAAQALKEARGKYPSSLVFDGFSEESE